jgi:hypothetical protein
MDRDAIQYRRNGRWYDWDYAPTKRRRLRYIGLLIGLGCIGIAAVGIAIFVGVCR